MHMMAEADAVLSAAREAVKGYRWAEAFEHFGAADAETPLGAEDLDAMADCAWWIGKMRHCIALRERAHTGFLKRGDKRQAARVATKLADHHANILEPAAASSWIQTATRILDDEPEGVEHGWLSLGLALAARHEEELETSQRFAVEAVELAGRYGDKDLLALGLAIQGSGWVFLDEIDRGMPMLEEATVAAVSGELGPHATGWIYCLMITVSTHLVDWQRAGQWAEAAKRWCDRQAISGFPGVCRVHRAKIMRLRGAFSEAEEEAKRATDELSSFNLQFTALAFRELGEIRLRLGDIDAAEEAFSQANEMGVTPQPGLAQAQLMRGKAKAAASSLKRALGDDLRPLDRAKLLPTQLDVALELDDLDTARRAASELGEIAATYSSPALAATAAASAGAVALADGTLDSAQDNAAQAKRLFHETDLIYEAARASVLLGEIHRAQRNDEAARSEISSALAIFDTIGAVPDAARARNLLDSMNGSGTGS